ncbi:hypothetical protein F443_11699 [Phytophthora nicotianae P1569]|uniref:Uncharacterized protein n=1 Tax=Phytophthora nicotianae P1569 TaxID=1317065 RepID=V9EZ22_PHYNI|nr:hypothetical protein F443_11699 [Phytophthora nicotianae P1569]
MSGFRARWAELKKVGWTSRRPVGLSDNFTYIKPGKTKKDTHGIDYFVGEEELMRHLDRIDLANAAVANAKPTNPAWSDKDEGVSEQATSLRPTATSCEPKNTESQTEALRTESDERPSSADAAADCSESDDGDSQPSPTLQYESPHVSPTPRRESPSVSTRVAYDQQLTDEASGSDETNALQRSLDEEFTAAGSEDESEEDSRPRRSARIAAIPSDINAVQDTDDTNDYNTLASEGENDDGVSNGDVSDLGESSEEEINEDTGEEDAEDALFDETLVDAVGGIAVIVQPHEGLHEG